MSYPDTSSVDSVFASLGYDEVILHAIEIVHEIGSCSVSMLQRRMRIGYTHAARLVDQMYDLGIVGPYEGAKPRCVIMDRDSWIDFCNRSLHELTPARTYSDSSDGEIFSISPEEAQLIKDFRRLPKRDQEFIRQTMDMIMQPHAE